MVKASASTVLGYISIETFQLAGEGGVNRMMCESVHVTLGGCVLTVTVGERFVRIRKAYVLRISHQ